MPFVRRFWPVLLLLLLPLWPLRRAVFLGEPIGAFDQIRQMAPWNGPKPSVPFDVLQADSVLQFYPWRDLVFRAWGERQLPAWNHYELCGTPLLANSQSAALYPPHVILGLLRVPTAMAMTLLAWMHLAWAGLGVYVLCRRIGASKLGGCVAGGSFSLSVFMVLWAGLPSVTTTVAWIPWVLGGVHLCFAPRDHSHGWVRSLGPSAGLAFAIGMMMLGGHLQFAAYGLMAAAVLVIGLLAEGWKARPLLGIGRTVLGVCLGIALAAPQLVPTLAYSQFSHRQNKPTEAGYQGYVGGAIRPFELANLVSYFTLGDPRSYSDVADAPNYWVPIVKRGANLAESAVTLGPVVLFGVCVLPFLRAERRQWLIYAVIGLLALALALGTPLNRLLYFGIPSWSASGSPGRVIVLFVLVSCVLAGLAITSLEKEPIATKKRVIALPLALLVGVLAMRLGYGVEPPGVSDSLGWRRYVASASVPGAIWTLAGLLLAAGIFGVWKTRRPLWLALAGVAAWIPTGSGLSVMTGKELLPQVPGLPNSARIAIVNSDWRLDGRAKVLMPPNTATLSGVHEAGGYDSLLHRDTVAILHDAIRLDPAPRANGNMMLVKPTADPSKLANIGVSEVWSLVELPEIAAVGRRLNQDGFIRYALLGPGRASVGKVPAGIVRENFGSMTVRANGPGDLIVRDRAMPGWTAQVDGRQTQLKPDRWLVVPELGPGWHTVMFNYSPPGLSSTLWASCLAWALVLSFGLGSAFQSVRKVNVG